MLLAKGLNWAHTVQKETKNKRSEVFTGAKSSRHKRLVAVHERHW